MVQYRLVVCLDFKLLKNMTLLVFVERCLAVILFDLYITYLCCKRSRHAMSLIVGVVLTRLAWARYLPLYKLIVFDSCVLRL